MTNNDGTQDQCNCGLCREDVRLNSAPAWWDDDLTTIPEGIPCAESDCDARAYGPCVPGDDNSDWLCPEHAAAYRATSDDERN
jgi:hypothetical protein